MLNATSECTTYQGWYHVWDRGCLSYRTRPLYTDPVKDITVNVPTSAQLDQPFTATVTLSGLNGLEKMTTVLLWAGYSAFQHSPESRLYHLWWYCSWFLKSQRYQSDWDWLERLSRRPVQSSAFPTLMTVKTENSAWEKVITRSLFRLLKLGRTRF